jgi:CRP-like cAMP-binding protein
VLFGELGTSYEDGEIVIGQGDPADCMYVVQQGQVEVVAENQGGSVRFAVLEAGDVFGEMALFGKEPRSATVRAIGKARILSVNKRTFLRRVHEDPSLAYGLLKKMAERIRGLDSEILLLKKRLGE